jgi:hypothetical protein
MRCNDIIGWCKDGENSILFWYVQIFPVFKNAHFLAWWQQNKFSIKNSKKYVDNIVFRVYN